MVSNYIMDKGIYKKKNSLNSEDELIFFRCGNIFYRYIHLSLYDMRTNSRGGNPLYIKDYL